MCPQLREAPRPNLHPATYHADMPRTGICLQGTTLEHTLVQLCSEGQALKYRVSSTITRCPTFIFLVGAQRRLAPFDGHMLPYGIFSGMMAELGATRDGKLPTAAKGC